MPAFFICGTDTGVGKTIVTAALCAYLNSQKIKAAAYKPLESGCSPAKGMPRHLKRADSEFLKSKAAMDDDIDLINPYYFKEPLAPGVAAQRERKTVSFAKIKNNLKILQKKYDVVFVEGAGGLLVPVKGQKTNVDLIKALGLPVLLVARLGLGTINHSLLTLDVLKRNSIPVKGLILNEVVKAKTISEKTNPAVLKKYHTPLWGVFRHLKSKSKKALIQNCQRQPLRARIDQLWT